MTTTRTSHSLPELAEVPARAVLAIAGEGRPEGAPFQAAVAVFDRLFDGDRPLEGAYWSGDDELSFDLSRPDDWRWILAAEIPMEPERAVAGVYGEIRPPERVARLVHHGRYEDEEPSLEALYAFIASEGLEPAGPHTEVYMTDPRAVPPEELRTELRVRVR